MPEQPSLLSIVAAPRLISMLCYQEPPCKRGSYGIVFFLGNGRAIKVFYRDTLKTESHTRQVFQSEVDAYEIASAIPAIRSLAPAFYGKVVVEGVKNQGVDISAQFYLDCAYEMASIEGRFMKFNELPLEAHQSAADLRSLFHAAGIMYTRDSSMVVGAGETVSCIIDFATREHEVVSQMRFQ